MRGIFEVCQLLLQLVSPVDLFAGHLALLHLVQNVKFLLQGILAVHRVSVGFIGFTAQNTFNCVCGDIAFFHLLDNRFIEFVFLAVTQFLSVLLCFCHTVIELFIHNSGFSIGKVRGRYFSSTECTAHQSTEQCGIGNVFPVYTFVCTNNCVFDKWVKNFLESFFKCFGCNLAAIFK